MSSRLPFAWAAGFGALGLCGLGVGAWGALRYNDLASGDTEALMQTIQAIGGMMLVSAVVIFVRVRRSRR